MKLLGKGLLALKRQAWFARHQHAFVRVGRRSRPRLLVDLSVIARHDAGTGIQRVVRSVWTELAGRSPSACDIVAVYAGSSHGYCVLDMSQRQGRRRLTKTVVAAGPGDKFFALDLAAHTIPACLPQLTAWKSAGAEIYTVVYDCLPLDRPGWFNPKTRQHFERWFEWAVAYSDGLLCISDAVARTVRSKLPDPPAARIGRLHLSGSIAGSSPSKGIPPAFDEIIGALGRRPAVLMVGTIEPRKGHDVALAAFEHLWQEQPEGAPSLVIVGKPGWKTAELQAKIRAHPELGKRLFWVDCASDEALSILYERSTMLLVASRDEGFGLPLSEAACNGKWVLARDLPVFREQALRNCIFFGDDRPEILASSLLEAVKLAGRTGPPPSVLPSWSDCVDALLVELGIDREPCQLHCSGPRALQEATRR